MHKEHVQSDFTKTVEEIRHAEEKAEKMKQEAKETADQTLKKAKDIVLKIGQETEEEIVKIKNSRFQHGKEKIESDIGSTLDKAHKEAEKIKKMKLNPTELDSVLNKFVKSLSNI
ncbi:hypothetical protein HYT84_00940 [Candidatus Micrarchaeota archaeon]|nr:hypothetical protein [Candidatus Micrarchaeota archaeon]